MAMVVPSWQDPTTHHATDDVTTLPPAHDSVTTPPHLPSLSQAPVPPAAVHAHHPTTALPNSTPQITEQGLPVVPPHTPTTPSASSVSDGSQVTNMEGSEQCPTSQPQQQSQQQPNQTSGSSGIGTEKPHIECVVSFKHSLAWVEMNDCGSVTWCCVMTHDVNHGKAEWLRFMHVQFCRKS